METLLPLKMPFQGNKVGKEFTKTPVSVTDEKSIKTLEKTLRVEAGEIGFYGLVGSMDYDSGFQYVVVVLFERSWGLYNKKQIRMYKYIYTNIDINIYIYE